MTVGPSSVTTDLDAMKRAAFPRNAFSTVLWEATWGIGMPFCLLYVVVPAYLLVLNTSRWLIQTVMVSYSVLAIIQFASPYVIHGPRRKLRTYALWCCFGGLWLAYGLAASLGWARMPEGGWRACFLAMAVSLGVLMHLGSPAYNEMIVENVPIRRRGRLSAWRSMALGLSGLLGVWVASWVMRRSAEPTNFHNSFMIGGSIFFLSCLCVLLFRDVVARSARGADRPAEPVFRTARGLLGNFGFRTFLFFYALYVCGQSLVPMIVAYGRDVLGMAGGQTVWLTVAYLAGTVLAGALVFPLADKYGFRIVGIIGAGMLAMCFLLPLLVPGSRIAVLAGYALYGGTNYVNMLLLANFGSELAPHVKTGIIMAAGNVTVSLLCLVVAPLAGLLVDLHGPGGYLTVFVTGTILSLLALLGYCLIVREPRKGHELIVRVRG